MTVGSIDGENIECLTNHLSIFTMVVLDAEVYCAIIKRIHKHIHIYNFNSMVSLSFYISMVFFNLIKSYNDACNISGT
jgi:hypothetical protein